MRNCSETRNFGRPSRQQHSAECDGEVGRAAPRVIRHRDQVRLLLKWEEKGANGLAAAKAELQLKTAVWPEIYYGPLLYLLTFPAAGPEFQFYAVQRAAIWHLTPVGPILRLNTLVGKSQLPLASLLMYRFLYAVSVALPSTVAPVNKLLKITKDGITRTLLISEGVVVEKADSPCSRFQFKYGVTIDLLKGVYEVSRGIPNLNHSRQDTPVVIRDAYRVQLEPVGITPAAAIPTSEQQFACAARDGLTLLDGLHKASCTVMFAGITSRATREKTTTSCWIWSCVGSLGCLHSQQCTGSRLGCWSMVPTQRQATSMTSECC